MELDPMEHQDPVRLVAMLVDGNGPGSGLADFDDLHRRADRHPHRLLGHADSLWRHRDIQLVKRSRHRRGDVGNRIGSKPLVNEVELHRAG